MRLRLCSVCTVLALLLPLGATTPLQAKAAQTPSSTSSGPVGIELLSYQPVPGGVRLRAEIQNDYGAWYLIRRTDSGSFPASEFPSLVPIGPYARIPFEGALLEGESLSYTATRAPEGDESSFLAWANALDVASRVLVDAPLPPDLYWALLTSSRALPFPNLVDLTFSATQTSSFPGAALSHLMEALHQGDAGGTLEGLVGFAESCRGKCLSAVVQTLKTVGIDLDGVVRIGLRSTFKQLTWLVSAGQVIAELVIPTNEALISGWGQMSLQPEEGPQPAPPSPTEVRVVDDPSIWGPPGPAQRTGVGYDGDVWSTGAEGSGHTAVNGAEWITDISGGTYRIEVFIPRSWATATVDYYIRNNCGQNVVRVDQNVYYDQWVDLGTYSIDGPRASVGSNDIADPRGSIVGWDAVRWTRVDGPPPSCPAPPVQTEVRIVDDPSIWGPSGPARRTGVGYEGDVWSTGAEGSGHAAVNGAEWITDINGGTYRIEVFIPRSWATATVDYYVRHNGGQSVVRIDQNVYYDQWVDLGTYTINGPRASVGSNDVADPRGSIVGWDAIRWTRV